MKRTIRTLALLLGFCLVFLGVTACNKTTPPEDELPVSQPASSDPAPETPQAPAFPSVNLNDHSLLYDTYLRPFYEAGILSYSWYSYSDIKPDQLVNVIVAMSDSSSWGDEGRQIPADSLEELVRSYLDVPADHLRKSSSYSAKTNTYNLMGIGAPLYINITDARQVEDVLSITFDALDRADDKTPIWSSTVSILLSENGFKYMSCKHEAKEGLTYTGPFDDLLTFMAPEWFIAVALVLLPFVYLIRQKLRRAH